MNFQFLSHPPTRLSKANLAIMLCMLCAVFAFGQANWRAMGNNKSTTFYQVQQDFNQYWQGKPPVKGKGYKVFKRWENYMTPRVYPSGNMLLPSTNYANFMQWKQQNVTSSNVALGNWTAVGPLSKPSGYDAGVGRVDFVRFDPTNSNIMYVGTPDGGLWKSNNGGTFWSTNTDFLPIIGCADLAIDPTNTQVMYLATGNWEGDRRSIGVLKSTDGGSTWNTTSLSWTALDNYKIRKLLMDPTDPSIMMAATDGGIFRTTDGWATNTLSSDVVDFKDMEFKPGDPNTVYAAGIEFWVSTDNGLNWAQITDGLPDPADVSRIALGVTVADDAYVYVLAGDAAGGFKGLYRSTDSGISFVLQSSTPNLLNASKDGTGTGGQASHDMAIAVSPVDADLVTIGGINQWQSSDGGVQWNLVSYWLGGDDNYPGQGDGPPDYVHADIQSIEYLPGSSTTMFTTCDGGISKSTNNGLNWTDISHNLGIAQQTGVALSATDPGIMVTGLQDIGSLKADAGAWSVINGGDGEDAFIDRSNNLVIVSSNPLGSHAISFDGGINKSDITGLPSGAQWFSPISQDPTNLDLVYAGGRTALWSTLELYSVGASCDWTELGTPPGNGNIIQFVVAPSNNNIIYAIKMDAFSISTDAGNSWENRSGTLPVGDIALTDLSVSDTDPGKVWVTFSGYSAGDKVFTTTDGGLNWTNISAGLPNLPINSIVYVNGTVLDAVYIGADIGIYYQDNVLATFVPFNSGLPNVAVTDLEIYYPTQKLRASTYGRGTWESDFYEAQLVTCSGSLSVCIDTPVFELTGSSPADGTYSGPGVNAGTFDPALAGAGIHTITYTNGGFCNFSITVNPAPTVSCPDNSVVNLDTPAFALTGSTPSGGIYTGAGANAGIFDPAIAGTGEQTITYTFTDVNACTNSCTYLITVNLISAIQELEQRKLLISIAPNPTSGLTGIRLSLLAAAETQLTVTNALGQTVLLRNMRLLAGENQFDLNLQSLPSGVYYLRISAGERSNVAKLVKQ